MWIPRPPNDPGRPGPEPGSSLGPSGSPPRFGFLYHLCTIISSCFYVFCCCWVLEDCFGGPRRRHNHLGPPFGSPEYPGPILGPEPPELRSPPLGHFGPRSHPGPIGFPGEPQLGHVGPSSQSGPVGFPGTWCLGHRRFWGMLVKGMLAALLDLLVDQRKKLVVQGHMDPGQTVAPPTPEPMWPWTHSSSLDQKCS